MALLTRTSSHGALDPKAIVLAQWFNWLLITMRSEKSLIACSACPGVILQLPSPM